MRIFITVFICVFAGLIASLTNSVQAQDGLERTLSDSVEAIALLSKPGHHAIIRHTYAPESTDPLAPVPPGCEDERNLSRDGIVQARNLGAAFAKAQVMPDYLYTSHICRCRDTAVLMDLGEVLELAEIAPIFRATPEESRAQTQALKEHILSLPSSKTSVMITHGFNVSALLGSAPAQGDGFVFKIDGEQLKIVAPISSHY